MLIANSNRQYGIFDEGIKVTGYSPPLAQTPDDNYRQNWFWELERAWPESSSNKNAVWELIPFTFCPFSKATWGRKPRHTKCNYYLSRLWSPSCADTAWKSHPSGFSQKPSVQGIQCSTWARARGLVATALWPTVKGSIIHFFWLDWANHRGSVVEIRFNPRLALLYGESLIKQTVMNGERCVSSTDIRF